MAGMALRGIRLRSRASRYQGSGLATGFAVVLGIYVAVGLGFYWLMQPTVIANRGMAAYQAPPMTVVRDAPWVPPASSETDAVFTARRNQEIAESRAAATRNEIKAAETPPAPRRETRARARPAHSWGYTSGRSGWGFRPWF
jgi:hypothetical protein